MGDLQLPFEGLPTAWIVLFAAAFCLIGLILLWTAVLFSSARKFLSFGGARARAEDYRWVFLVPARDEETVIEDSVRRLLGFSAPEKRIIVIDDGSADRTGSILAGLASEHPELEVLTRQGPEAGRGKADALNAAYRQLIAGGDFPNALTLVCVVDADGRLDADSAEQVASHFDDDSVGGVQLLVRIYNRQRLLTYLQDVEFAIYGYLYQAGRSPWGTAGMGGNGQFNRLSALEEIADADGPWRDRLTEDQDLGLRLIEAGWKSRQELHSAVHQQGIPGIRRLYRQRTRWAQGNLQALAHLARRAPVGFWASLELRFYLLNPLFQGFIGAVLFAAAYLAISGQASFWEGGPIWQLVLFYVLSFGGVIIGCVARGLAREGAWGALKGYLLAHPYAFYTWVLWPVLVRATLRQLFQRRGWAKTEREQITQRRP